MNLVQELFSVQAVKYSKAEILKSVHLCVSVTIVSYLQLYPEMSESEVITCIFKLYGNCVELSTYVSAFTGLHLFMY